MRRGLLLLAVLASAASLFAQQAKPQGFRISGIVINARDNSPVRRANITVNLVASGRNSFHEPFHTATDETGHFLLELPSAGDWQVNVSAHNIRSQNFEDHEGYFSGVVLTPTNPTYDLVFHAVPDAILTGTITDESGEPLRNAQVTLFEVNKSAQQTGGKPLQQKQGTQADDRGRYEFASLEAGTYMVQVQARPWYAVNLALPRSSAVEGTIAPLDPSLDVIYPTTWYPGGSDMAAAGLLVAHPGDSLQADVRLVPVPSAHLVITSAAPAAGRQALELARPGQNTAAFEQPQPFRGNPTVTLILPDGTQQPVYGQFFSRNARGDVEVGGLAPGTYQVVLPGSPDSPPRTTTVQLNPGGTTTELAVVQQTTPVSIAVDGDSRIRPSQIVLRSSLTGQSFPDFNLPEIRDRQPRGFPDTSRGRTAVSQQNSPPNSRGRQGGQYPGGGRARAHTSSDDEDATLQVPPGHYEVVLSGSSNSFLTGLVANGAIAVGKLVTISESPAALTVHVGTGLATVQGMASINGKPSVGAMVLLVPAAMGDPASLAVVHRDQTNTDGSFRLDNVMPGPYILVAIDHGWSLKWTDPDTLRPYLMRGTPLDLRPSAVATPKLMTVAP